VTGHVRRGRWRACSRGRAAARTAAVCEAAAPEDGASVREPAGEVGDAGEGRDRRAAARAMPGWRRAARVSKGREWRLRQKSRFPLCVVFSGMDGLMIAL
jgi:hypothetical protein